MKENCLTRALDQWNSDKDMFRIWYNGNHVISLESDYEGTDLSMMRTTVLNYNSLREYGTDYFVSAFQLNAYYRRLLKEYFKLHEQ